MKPSKATLGRLQDLLDKVLHDGFREGGNGALTPRSYSTLMGLRLVLEEDPAFDEFKDASIHMGWGEKWTTTDNLIGWLIDRSNKTNSLTAVQDLKRYFSLPATRGRLVVAIANLRVDAPLTLARKIMLVPLEAVPAATQRHFGRPAGPPALSALVRRFRGIPKTWKGDAPELDRSARDFEDAAQALTLVGPSAPAIVGYWSELDENIPFSTGSFSEGAYPIHEVSLASYSPMHIAGVRLREQAQLVVAFSLSMPERNRQRLRTSLDRLSLSGRRGRTADRYVDLAVAVEALLSHKDDPITEIGYRLRVRAARFLGGTTEKRHATAEAIKEIYNNRSKILHTGESPKARKLEEVESMRRALRQHRELVVELITCALENGLPDWPSFDLEDPKSRSNLRR